MSGYKHRGQRSIHVLLLLGILCGSAGAQDQPSIEITLSPRLQAGLQVVYISDLDVLKQGISEYYFDIAIHHVLQDWENTRMIIQMEREGSLVASLESDPFTLPVPEPEPPPGSPAYRASNMDLLNTGLIPGTDIQLNFDTRSYESPSSDFETYAIQSGKLQRGVYFLKAILDNPDFPQPSESSIRLEITNPSLIRLLSPENRSIVQTEFPLFQYESDAVQFIVSMYRRLNPEDDVETVLTGHPVLEYTTPLKQFSYHVTDGEPLESGATYLWYVRALVHTTNGLEEFASNVWQFTVDTQGGLSLQTDLEDLLGPLLGDRVEEIAQQLAGYELKRIEQNGSELTLNAFMEYILMTIAGSFQVIDLEIR